MRPSNRRVDLISTLPDSILCHILSFLSTKYAVATSLLSKRWRQLWRSVAALDFEFLDSPDDIDAENVCFKFTESVNSVLLLRDPLQPIQRFHLNYQGDDDYTKFSIVNRWLPYVLQRRVEHFHVNISDTYPHKLPVANFRCATLVVLKLRGCHFDMNHVSSVALPSLKVLDLEYTLFPSDLNLIQFLSRFPILEELKGKPIFLEDELSLKDLEEFKSLCLPKLISADIINSYIQFPLKALCNITTLCLEISKVDHLNMDIPTFHNMTRMSLIFNPYDFRLLAEMLEHCPRLQYLVLAEDEMNGYKIMKLDDTYWVDPEHIPECLSSYLVTCSLVNYEGLKGELLLARYILKSARVLQRMTIAIGYNIEAEDTKVIEELSLWPRNSATCQILYEDYWSGYNRLQSNK